MPCLPLSALWVGVFSLFGLFSKQCIVVEALKEIL